MTQGDAETQIIKHTIQIATFVNKLTNTHVLLSPQFRE